MALDLADSLRRAEQRLGSRPAPRRRPRSDRGGTRIAPAVVEQLAQLVQDQDRIHIPSIVEALAADCRRQGSKAPSRATVYQLLGRLPTRSYEISELALALRGALYNLGEQGRVPGHQLAFYAMNYGDLEAASAVATLPWLALYQAARLPGWRPRAWGLFTAILAARGIHRPARRAKGSGSS